MARREHYLWSGNKRSCTPAAANAGRGWAGNGEKRWSGGRHGRQNMAGAIVDVDGKARCTGTAQGGLGLIEQ